MKSLLSFLSFFVLLTIPVVTFSGRNQSKRSSITPIVSIITVFILFLSAYLVEAKSLKKGEVYRSLAGEQVIEVISKNELEITKGGDIILANYSFKGGKLRVVFTALGTKMIEYYELTKEGLKDKKGRIFYSKVAYQKTGFTDNGNGTVTHGITGLMWQKEDNNKKHKWKGAIKYCNGLTLAEYTDWRLPKKEELGSLVKKKGKPTIDTTYFPNTKSAYYWASTTNGGTLARIVDFTNGSDYYGNTKTYTTYVRCVR